jgi:hypothetical protein
MHLVQPSMPCSGRSALGLEAADGVMRRHESAAGHAARRAHDVRRYPGRPSVGRPDVHPDAAISRLRLAALICQ